MEKNISKMELVNLILGDEKDTKIEEEEMIHLLLEQKITSNINKVANENETFGARMADKIAKFAGSWTFLLSFIGCLFLWICVNALFLVHPYDPYPYILLNLVLSCVAAVQAPVIMMSQNRQEEKDRLRAQNDYKTNLKSEIIVEDLHQKLDQLLTNQEKLQEKITKIEKSIISQNENNRKL